MNKLRISLLVLLTALTTTYTWAQSPAAPIDGKTYAMDIVLKNGSSINYSLSQIDHVTYLPDVGIKIYLNGEAQSVDYLFSQMTSISYNGTAREDQNTNANWNSFSMTTYPEAWRLEYPHLNSNTTDNQVVVKRTNDYGVTFSLEWDNSKIANRWTCYTLHAGNNLKNVDRADDFKADPDVTTSAQTSDYSGSGFSRGHLCPSQDRLCSTEQNKQTFYLTNMQPQWQKHNGGLWSNLEQKVNDWSQNTLCDTMYVVKAATIADVTINDVVSSGVYDEKCNGRLLVPKYFYMALLAYDKAHDTYQALAFWTIHQDVSDTNKKYGDYAITIDELEKRTGIDFFCNLPDEIEAVVESQIDLSYWGLTTSP